MSRYKPYPAYKDSGTEWLGEVPEGWDVRRMATMFREAIRPGDPDLPILSISSHYGITDYEIAPEDRDRRVSQIEDKTNYKRVEPGDLAYNTMAAWQGALGAVTVDGLVSPAYVVAEPTWNFYTKYIEHLLRTPMAIEEMRRYSRGIADFRMRLYWDYFRDLKGCLPPKNEQHAIAANIDHETSFIDTLIQKNTKLMELLKEKRSALITYAVTKGLDPNAKMKDSGVEWIGEMPEGWEICSLKYVLEETNSGGTPDTENHEFWCSENGGTPWVSISDMSNTELVYKTQKFVTEKGINSKRLKVFPKKTLLFSMYASLGHIAELNMAATTNQAILGLVPNSEIVNHGFLKRWLQSVQPYLIINASNATQDNLNAEKVKNLPCVKLSISEQKNISAHIDHETAIIDTLIAKTKHSIDILKERRSAFITAAVTGQIDLREAA